MSIITILIYHSILNFIFLFFFDHFKQIINVYDYPDGIRKQHSKPVPLIGGYLFLINIILFFILKGFLLSELELKILTCASFFLFVGIIDDKYNLSPYIKFFFLIIFLLIFFILTDNMILEKITIYKYSIILGKNFGIFFSILCVLLFVNAFNLFDGINLQSSIYGLFILIFLVLKGFFFEIIIISIIPLLIIIYLNYKNLIFMGDSGTLFLGSFISLIIIANYTEFKSITVDEIFLLMFIPGVDMLRLFFQRIFTKKNPFLGDREHLHHYFLSIYNYKTAIISILLISILPTILNIFLTSGYIIVLIVIFYIFLIYFLKKN